MRRYAIITKGSDVETKLGKIESVKYGIGGYQDAQFGLHLTISGKAWGVQTSDAFWAMEPSSRAEWGKSDQDVFFAALTRRIIALLDAAKCDSVDKLKGKPVSCVFDGNALQSWQILEDVL